MDIKRTLLWIIFALSLLMLYNNWQQANGRAPLFGSPPASAPVAVGASDALPTAVATAPAAAVATVAPAPAGQLVTVTTDVYEAQVDTVGGTLVSLKLLRQQDKDGAPVQLFAREPGHQYLARSGLIGAAPLPNHTVVFAAQPGPRELGARNEVALSLVAEQNGVKLVKTYVFKRGDYVIDVRFDVTNAGHEPVAPTLYLELVRDDKQIDASRFYSTFTGPAVYSEAEKFQKIKFDAIAKGDAKYVPSIDANQPGWIGMVQHYFASAWIPQATVKRDVYVDKLDANLYRVGVKQTLGAIAPGATVTTDARLFAGPQLSHLLEQTAPGLELVKDYGWLTIVAKPLFWLLEKIHLLLGNWGWTIVLLTVLIKLAFFPLSAASYKSMAKMKELSPKMAALKEQHKGDPQQLNQAMMQLYRSEKVNPLGGCFPILIQIPVFIALYWVLLASVEMRHAPWVGWIHDLSAPDPYYVLPVLMAITSFVQTRLNPTPPDPVQAKVMLIMPLAFSAMTLFIPAGMVLYWIVNNGLSIAQQWSINRMMGHHKKG